MTEKNDFPKNWRSKQDWIKDVLFKSGTDLMEITTKSTTIPNNAKNGTKKLLKKPKTVTTTVTNGSGTCSNEIQDIQHKMVYYQSTPLMIKTEQPSQAQLCSPLRAPSTSKSSSIVIPHVQQQCLTETETSQSYQLTPHGITAMQQQPHPKQPSLTASIHTSTTRLNASEQSFLTNIKSEPLSHGVTIFATSEPVSTSVLKTEVSLVTGSSTNSLSTNTRNGGAALEAAAITMRPSLTATTPVARKSAPSKLQFKCEQCGMTFGSKSAHTSHTKSHIKSGESIGLAGMNVNANVASTLVTGHSDVIGGEGCFPVDIPKSPGINGVVGGDPYKCNVCQKTFAVPARLIRHYRTHTGERPFECEFCHKLFSVKENLQVHRRIHTKERPYKCEVCGRAFEHSGKLHRHMRIHTGERPHKCSVCEKTFIQSGQLVIHMRTHTGEKPYKCPVEGCGKGFTCSKQLKVHSRTHTGEKPYHCDICLRDFGYNHVLKLHRVQHYGSKCYKCTICDKTFKSKKEMEAHIKKHANEIPDDDTEIIEQPAGSGVLAMSASSSSSGEAASGPDSPQSPSSTAISTNTKGRKLNTKRGRSSDTSASSGPSSISNMLIASDSERVSGLPPSMTTLHSINSTNESDHHNRDNNQQNRQTLTLNSSKTGTHQQNMHIMDEIPTDLSKRQKPKQTKYLQGLQHGNYLRHQLQSSFSYVAHFPAVSGLQQPSLEPPTINPALLEAATIASNRNMDSLSEEEVKQAALQIMQLRRAQQQPQLTVVPSKAKLISAIPETADSCSLSSSSTPHTLIGNDLAQYDDTQEANDLIEHYRRGELACHGLNKGYAPVPKFESSLLNNDIIVRQVEAAIAPLRSSTESPERSSSPESDTILMMADRDIMTLPLRKRKLYIHEEPPNEEAAVNTTIHEVDKAIVGLPVSANGDGSTSNLQSGAEVTTKVMRMSSVIQFAKAS